MLKKHLFRRFLYTFLAHALLKFWLFCGFVQNSFVVCFVFDNLEASINLLEQYDSHHLMRKGHFGKRQFKIGSSADFIAQPEASPYDKSNIALSFQGKILYLLS